MDVPARVPFWFLIANVLLVTAAFVVGVFLGGRRWASLPDPQVTALQLAHREILRSHVDEHDPGALLDRAIAGMVDGLDEYSRYVPPSRVAAFEEDTTGIYEGIGVVVTVPQGELVVHFPFPGGPSDRAGLRVGDRILSIDGVEVASFPAESRLEEANHRLRGPAGRSVAMELRRSGGETAAVSVARGPVHKPTVKWTRMLDEQRRIGYLHLGDFHRDSPNDLADAMAELQARPGGLAGLIIDLRFNGGGLLAECVAICRLFVAEGNIVATRRRGSEVVEQHDAIAAECRWPDLPLVLLVNQGSASASEVMAGALQDHGRATLVGTRTYGKGVVNTIFSWKDLDFRLKLTTAYYYTPNGRNIEKRHRRSGDTEEEGGIAPDVAVAVDDELATEIGRALLGNEVPRQHREAFAALAAELGLRVPAPLGADRDPQLTAALAELTRKMDGGAGGQGR